MKNDDGGYEFNFSYGDEKSRSRADQIYERFVQFWRDNPDVWRLFVRFTNELITAGFEHYAVGAVFERIRWHVNIETKSHDGLKLNNDFRAYYARLYHVAFPKHDGFFRNRKLNSSKRPAFKDDIAFSNSGPSEYEVDLYRKLAALVSSDNG